MSNDSPHPDADELLHLAMEAARRDKHEDAIGYLRRAIGIAPEHAKAHYFLAAEHAQIGMIDRAVAGMENAVRLDPGMHTAHFQLGLLHLTSGRVTEARAAWQPLDELGETNVLFLFKTGLERLAVDDFDACRTYLQNGIAMNDTNPALNVDMQRVIDNLPASGQAEKNTGQTSHVLLSGYTTDDRR
ncbi:MAG: tetratricopeptide repeat protein [Pseudomonadota bacterium]